MLSTENTKQYWCRSRHSRTLAKSRSEISLPFFSVLERCTTLARLDLGIVGLFVGSGVALVLNFALVVGIGDSNGASVWGSMVG